MARRRYAEELRALSRLRSELLVEAFARVPRERYLGAGPWRVRRPSLQGGYTDTPDADPRHLYHDVLVAIDEERRLNNGQPSGLALWLDQIELARGESVVHVGCGLGYYTAVIADVIGSRGSLLALELDPHLAERARSHLAELPWVEVHQADGSQGPLPPSDAVFVNAGATHPAREWLECLKPGGRLLFPLTVSSKPTLPGFGHFLRIVREEDRFSAGFVSPVGIYPCLGARDESANERLRASFGRGGEAQVSRLRLDDHTETGECWLHAPDFCLA